jgi:putative hemolysin
MDSWLIIVISLVFSAFFSGIEIAFITANKLRIELESKQGFFSSKIISSFFLPEASKFIGTLLVGNNIALVVYGIMMAGVLEPLILYYVSNGLWVLVIQTIVSTLVILFTAEFLPKALFRINPNKILGFFALPVLVVYFILYPVVFIVIGISDLVLKHLFRLKIETGKVAFDRVELNNYLREVMSGDNEQDERDHEIRIFQNALDFAGRKVRDSMIPRPEIIALDVDASIEELKETFVKTGLSKILIYRETIDEIIGYVHSYEMFRRPSAIREVLLPVLIIPETMPSQEAMKLFLAKRKSIAVVVDEFGGTAGVLTIEDVMEEIFGDIEDEHDTEVLEEEKISDNEFLFSGRLDIDYLNDEYKLNLPASDDYDTLAGLIITYEGSIPSLKEEIQIEDFRFVIEQVSETRIERVRVFLLSGD